MDTKEEQKKINLPSSFAIIVWKQLKEKYGIEQRKDRRGFPDWSCTKDELGLITSLNITNPTRGSLRGISQLYNLRSLTITSTGSNDYKKDRDIYTISAQDMNEICKTKGLTCLEINNQNDISYIDLDELENLEVLSITNNTNLKEIFGLDSQTKLEELTCYGNRSLMHIEGLAQSINQCNELTELNLDVLLFPESINYNWKTGEYSRETENKIANIANNIGTVKWHEALPGIKSTYKRDSIQINHYQMLKLHNKCCQLLSENVPECATNRDIIIGIEKYLAQNVIYDHESLRGKSRMASQNGVAMGPIGGANGAYNAIMLNQCVCEGYTRAMQYLLKLKGINSRNVMCIGSKDTLHMSDGINETIYTRYELPDEGYHSIICIEDEFSLYCDPCWNAGRYQNGDKSLPYTLLNKQEIGKTHTLSFKERAVANEHITVPKETIFQSIKSNELFINTRIEKVRQQRQEISEELYKGQVREERETI